MITIYDVAKARGAKVNERGAINGSEFDRLGLPMVGGCLACQATIAAGNAAPTRTGYLMCVDGCAEGFGFSTVQEFEDWTAAQKED